MHLPAPLNLYKTPSGKTTCCGFTGQFISLLGPVTCQWLVLLYSPPPKKWWTIPLMIICKIWTAPKSFLRAMKFSLRSWASMTALIDLTGYYEDMFFFWSKDGQRSSRFWNERNFFMYLWLVRRWKYHLWLVDCWLDKKSPWGLGSCDTKCFIEKVDNEEEI